jgi:hypothetical protein
MTDRNKGFAGNRIGSTGTPIAASSAAMLARLIMEIYLSVVAFGLRRASARACPGASRTRSGPFTAGPRKSAKNSATSLHPSFSVIRSRNSARPFSAIVKTPLSASKRSATARVSRRASARRNESSTAIPGAMDRMVSSRARSAKRRSCGRHSPGISATLSRLSALRPFTGSDRLRQRWRHAGSLLFGRRVDNSSAFLRETRTPDRKIATMAC